MVTKMPVVNFPQFRGTSIHFDSKTVRLIQYQSGNSCENDQQNGMDFQVAGQDKGDNEDNDTLVINEIFGVHQQQSGGKDQAYNYRP